MTGLKEAPHCIHICQARFDFKMWLCGVTDGPQTSRGRRLVLEGQIQRRIGRSLGRTLLRSDPKLSPPALKSNRRPASAACSRCTVGGQQSLAFQMTRCVRRSARHSY